MHQEDREKGIESGMTSSNRKSRSTRHGYERIKQRSGKAFVDKDKNSEKVEERDKHERRETTRMKGKRQEGKRKRRQTSGNTGRDVATDSQSSYLLAGKGQGT